jgi:hypothetical protein
MIHNITIVFKPKENLTCCHTKHLGRRECPERTQVPITLFPEGQKEEIGPREECEDTMS